MSFCNDVSEKIENDNVERISIDLVNNPITAKENENMNLIAKIQFDNLKHDFGLIEQGELLTHKFFFINTGEKDLIISNAKASCGCTVPNWPKEPIAPNEKKEIVVTFNSTGRSGKQSKTVTLVSNTIPNTTVLTITANILTK
tara:strand:- start:251 stop:679 length:429 start_codon:yes stop_codon:yes gene_type:complete